MANRIWNSACFARMLGALISLLYLFFSFFPALYVFEATLPPLDHLRQSEGKLVFRWMGEKGYLTGVEKDGLEQFFTCAGWVGSGNDCLEIPSIRALRGKTAKVWWFEQPVYFFDTYKRIARLEVEGISKVDYEMTRRRMQWAADYAPLWTGGFLLFCVMGVTYCEVLARGMKESQEG